MKIIFSILVLFLTINSSAQTSVPANVEYKNFLSQAGIFLLKSQPDNSLSAYLSCLKLNPKSAVSYFQLARIYFNSYDNDVALTYAKEAVNLQPDNYWYNIFLATIYEAVNDYPNAIKIYEDCISKNPSYNDYLHLVDLYVQFNKFPTAISTLNHVEEIYGLDPDIILKKVDLYKRQNKLSEEESELCKLQLIDSSSLVYLGMLQDFYLSTSQISKAQDVTNKMQSIDDQNPLFYLAKASLSRTLGQNDSFYSNLIESFKSSELPVDEKISIIHDIVTGSEIYDSEKVISLYNQILKTDSDDFNVHSSLADFYMTSEKFDSAAVQLKICSHLNKSDFSVWKKLFKLYCLIEDYDNLNTSVQEAEDFFPEQVDLMIYSAVASIYSSDYSQADEMLQQARDFGVEFSQSAHLFYFYSGVLNYKLKNFDLAFQNFDKFYNLNHSDLSLVSKYCYYLIEQKYNLSFAESLLNQCIALDHFNYYFYYLKAYYFYQIRDYNNALFWIQMSSRYSNDKFCIFELAGDIYKSQSDCSKAVENWNLALKLGADKLVVNNKIKTCN